MPPAEDERLLPSTSQAPAGSERPAARAPARRAPLFGPGTWGSARSAVSVTIVGVLLVSALLVGLAVASSARGITAARKHWPGTVPAGGIQSGPAQAAALVFGDPAEARPYAHPGGLVVTGRDNYQAQEFKNVSSAGGTVLLYLDVVVANSKGRYQQLLNKASACGPATGRWPGSYPANEWGYLNDFREGSVLQAKLRCVLETMIEENPQMGGWYADDVGSRSWFPGFDWNTFRDKEGYRAGAIAVTRTMREVADEHHLVFLVAGTWARGTLAQAGGGYPDQRKSGNSLADGAVVSHHDAEISYFGPYACSSQWAAASSVTRGRAVNYAVTSTAAGTVEYAASGCFAFVTHQTDGGQSATWGRFHPTGLPSHPS